MRSVLSFFILLATLSVFSMEGKANSSNAIDEKIEDIARDRSSWSNQRDEIYKEAGLSSLIPSTKAMRDSINDEISVMATNLYYSPLEGNIRALVEVIEEGNAQYLSQLRNNLPSKFLINLVSRRFDFKIKNGESAISAMKFDTEI